MYDLMHALCFAIWDIVVMCATIFFKIRTLGTMKNTLLFQTSETRSETLGLKRGLKQGGLPRGNLPRGGLPRKTCLKEACLKKVCIEDAGQNKARHEEACIEEARLKEARLEDTWL